MRYELWHIGSANLVDDFEDEAEAFDAARAYLTPDEHGVVIDVAVLVYDDAGSNARSLHGEELARLVFGPSSGGVRQSA